MSEPMTPRAEEASAGFIKVLQALGTDERESTDALLLGLASFLRAQERHFGSELGELAREALIDRLDEFLEYIREQERV